MPHIHTAPGQVDMTVEVFVVHEGKVLLRVHDKYGIWLSVGGHIELDEDPLEAAIREVREEVGLEVAIDDRNQRYRGVEPGFQSLIPPVFLHRSRISAEHEHVTLTYFATSSSNDVVPSGSDRSDTWHWFSREELADDRWGLKDNVAAFARAALDTLAPGPHDQCPA